MRFYLVRIGVLLLVCTMAVSCNNTEGATDLREGDILFQDLNCGELCDAIETVTEGINGKTFSHCALVVSMNDTLKVIEAIGDKVQVNSLQRFYARSDDTLMFENITVGRLKPQYEALIPKATSKLQKLVGQPYDNEFILNNGKWYCSELIYEVFKTANGNTDFFELEPMTFKDPKAESFYPVWIKYYEDLNREIPEGELGINPGLISRSEKIKIIEITRIMHKQF